MIPKLLKQTSGLILGTLLWAPMALAFDFSSWDALLQKYVAQKTIDGVALHAVAYQKLAKDPAYSKLISDLAQASPSSLTDRKEMLTFWINVYNIMAVKMVLDHYPVDSIKDAGSFFTSVWKKPVGTVGGKVRTLNEIEHEILRKLGEPRIHVAIVCASVSCPDLRKEAYKADKLDAQLDDQMRTFLANDQKGLRIDADHEHIHLSSIFKWFEEDFESQGGVIGFIRSYVPAQAAAHIKRQPLRISYMDYNWKLNEL